MASSVAVNVTPADNGSNRKEKIVDFTCDAAYPVGGYPLAPSTLGLEQILAVLGVGTTSGTPAGVIPIYNQATGKLQLFATGAAVNGALGELAANSALVSATTVLRLLVFGW